MERLYLCRHGQTRANIEGRFAGRTGEPLTPEGRRQAAEAARALAGRPVRAIHASPMARTLETARVMAGVLGCPVVEEPDLAEIRIPQWDGRLKADLAADPASGYAAWRAAPHRFRLPGAEDLAALQRRALSVVRRLLAPAVPGEAVLVTHLAVARCLVLALSGRPLAEYRSVQVANAAPLVIEGAGDHITLRGFPPAATVPLRIGRTTGI
ncbi:histidine phosphatase family protein [Dissulfurirhabdus thermomarina]|uniref:Histidine phosphatase family protein n=1 Tax=Dissulfurirhabdus thermomarina TaxID=1765737 RepID=A0A6N9TT65_DISTH|nr:histidine phosphatase family protein [Dissulfurirhabdus thermomarina]NDY42637.1 histidine phosphatase family protein [Dissulfurirhabdus thermomarina]NMX22683.1 histidine phosphatase family protein [Dissulfurirhabdus thermomarina]